MDYSSEKLVQETLDHLICNSNDNTKLTIVTIAHRLSTVQNADKIYVLKDGRIVERGTHADLYAKEGEYYNLVKLQNAKGLCVDSLESSSVQNIVELAKEYSPTATAASNQNKSLIVRFRRHRLFMNRLPPLPGKKRRKIKTAKGTRKVKTREFKSKSYCGACSI